MRVHEVAELLLTLIVFAGCVSNDKKKPESPLSVLNGDKYAPVSRGVSVGGLPLSGPFVTRKNSNTNVTGKLVENKANGYFKRPFKFQTVFLEKDQVQIKTISNEFGEFKFAADIPDGLWTLRLKSCPTIERNVEIKGHETTIGEWEINCVK